MNSNKFLLGFCLTFVMGVASSGMLALEQTTILLNAHHEILQGGIKSQSSLVVFSDGQFVFNSTTGGWGVCEGSEVGKFKGKMNSEEIKALNSALSLLPEGCKELKTCQVGGVGKERSFTWTLRSERGVFYLEEGDKYPKVISFLIESVPKLTQTGLKSLSLSLKKKPSGVALVFRNTGRDKIPLGFKADSFHFLMKSGSTVPLKKLQPSARPTPSHAMLQPDSQVTVNVPTDSENLEQAQAIIFDNSTDAHHMDPSGATFSLCRSLQD